MLDILDFEEAIEASKEYGLRHLLLGNGFSIACKPDIFSYSSLFEEARKKMSRELIEIFEAMETQDFEEVIKALQNAAKILGVYIPKARLAKARVEEDSETLKRDLIRAVAGMHPARPNEIAEERYAACRDFLSHFVGESQKGKIYSFNYDLLLYWALMHDKTEDGTLLPVLNHDDGFRKDPDDLDADYVEWQGEGASNTQNIHYLHGALHLFDAGHQLQKYTWINTGRALVDQASDALKSNYFPLFVAEGHSKSKLEKIMHNAYLHHNLKSFSGVCSVSSRAGKCLFVFGHSFADNDKHVLDKIGYGKIDHLFVSLFGDPDSTTNTEIRSNVDRICHLRGERGRELRATYYDASSAKVWG